MILEKTGAMKMVAGVFVKQVQLKTEPVTELNMTDFDFTDMIPTVWL